MKNLLLQDKKGFVKYLLAAFMFNIEHFISMGVFSLILNVVGKGIIRSYDTIIVVCILFVLYFPINFIVSRLFRIGYMKNTILKVRRKAFDKIINMSIKEYTKKSKEVYISNLLNDINIFERKFFVSFLNFTIDTSMFFMSFVCLVFLDLELSIGMLILSIFLMLLSLVFSKKVINLSNEVSTTNEHFTLDMSNNFNGMEIIKLNNIEDKFYDKSIKSIASLEKKKYLSTVFTELQSNLIRIFAYVIMTFVIIYLSLKVADGYSLGLITFMFQLSSRMSFNLVGVFPLWNEIKASATIYEKITKEEVFLKKETLQNEFSFQKEIEVTNVNFSYDNKTIFENVNFTIEKGKKYLIKGVSGAGKSTLMKLLAMTYDDYSGNIKVDGLDYRNISEDSFNKNVAFIYQDVFLFEDTIKNNITLYKELSEERIAFASESCGLDALFADKKNGIDEMLLENGKNLSGGQRQRISIARAIAKDSSIIFIDEGTSSLNEELGREIEQVFLNLPQTVIAISHRYYEGITDSYDYVLEIKNERVNQFLAKEYFGEVITC